ncbi:MAG: Tic20 family protein [Cyanobacteria bacterium J06642_11]
MTWRSADTVSDRILGSLPYMMALSDALRVGPTPWGALMKLTNSFPIVQPVGNFLLVLASPIEFLYALIPLGSLVVFFALFFFVVRNSNISHFIRFNALLSILIGFMITIGSVILNLLNGPGLSLLTDSLYNVLLFGGIGAVIYSVAQCLMGRYPEIPTISEAVHMQIGRF